MTVNTVHDEAGSTRPLVVDRSLVVWLAIFGACFVAFGLRPYLDWVKAPPPELLLPIADSVNTVADWFVHSGIKVLFHGLSWLLGWAMAWLQGFLLWLPWPAAILAVGALAWAAGGFGLAAFASATLAYMLLVGYWDESMKTLSLVGVSVPLSLALGLALGIFGFKSRTAARIIEPTLDVMQTVPAFAYLIPFLWLFGFGPVVGLIAGIIYAVPPMVRNVMLGLQRVPSHLVEAGRMAGCTRRQLLWRVQLPEALPTVMLGVNQTIMAALSIVIIAAVIGGSADIGWELLSTLRKAHFGPSLLAGLVIALIAMVLDRVSLGFAKPRPPRGKDPSPWRRHRLASVTAIGCAVIVVLAQFIPALHSFPEAWVVKQPAAWLNEGAHWLVITISPVIDAIKNNLLFYVLLPLNRGMTSVATPKIWGIELTPVVITTYVLLLAVVAGALARRFGWPAGAAIVSLGVVYYFGTTNLPWLVVFLVVIGLAHQVAGWRLASFAGAALAFMLVSGVWREVMMSIYLCGVAVFLSCVIGIPLGIWAALNDRVSAIVRPIIDTLQTMPQLVFLLPVVMLFKVGELPALMAMVSYAVVPAIRYTEHGIRNVRADAVEAARAFGCTRRQILLRVQLPQAVPEIMLGMNQTIMFGLSMLVISALVGTRDLGQSIYSALTNGNMGNGLVAGGSMALIAMVADRITQAWAARRKEALGLA